LGPRSVVSNDAFHDVSDVTPFHLAHIFNAGSCGSGACVLNSTTVDMVGTHTRMRAHTHTHTHTHKHSFTTVFQFLFPVWFSS
jgi:hypothetical protein